MERMAQMSSSFDKEASGLSCRKTKITSSFVVDSLSQLSVAEISLVNSNSNSKEAASSCDESFKNARASVRPGGLNGSNATHARDDVSTSSEESEIWSEKRRDDPVGDFLTKMLNEGKVPYFGYSRMEQSKQTPLAVEDGFKLCPLFTTRNYRATRQFLLGYWNRDRRRCSLGEQGNTERQSQSMRFLIESFVVCHIAIYSMNDIILRSLSEIFLFAVLATVSTILFDIEDVKRATSPLLSSTPTFSIHLIERFNVVGLQIFGIIEREFLWGHRFQGRTFIWSDDERLIKFRRKHRRLMATNIELKQKSRERRRFKDERKRREKRGESFTPLEMEKSEKNNDAREQLEAVVKQLTLKPPTFFPEKANDKNSSEISSREGATKRHLESLRYCQDMIFTCRRGQDTLKPVLIRATTSDDKRASTKNHNLAISPREAIEVVDQFPEIEINLDRHLQMDESVSTTTSEGWSVGYGCQDPDYSSEEDDDAASLWSYESELSARSMPWVVVGAKIGHKLLNARKLRRVIANPDAAQKLIPDEAKKLINGINNDMSTESYLSSSNANSWEGQATSDDTTPPMTPAFLPQSKSSDLPEIKLPVHGMWTSAASAAKTSNSYGAVTLRASPGENGSDATPFHGQLNGIRTPPSYQQIELQQRGGFTEHRTPSPLMNYTPTLPTQNNGTMLLKTSTPQQSNSLRQLISFKENKQVPPIPVTRLAPIEKGVKMVIPMFPPNCQTNATISSGSCFYQMGTVMSSRRIYIPPNHMSKLTRKRKTNCLSIKVILDKALLRGSNFFEMNLRIMDEWNYIPRHSKFPIGSCVATTFGVGVLVGWRVEDDMHIIRSLWNRSGPGSGLAYLRRNSVHSVVEAAVGFDVQTTYGAGKVLAYVRGGKNNTSGKYFVRLKGRHRGPAMEFNRCQILSCPGATFVPVITFIRAAALYRLEVLHYKAKLREKMLNGPSKGARDKGMWRNFSEYVDLFANSFSKAIAEDPDFDQEVDKFVCHIINLLDENEVSFEEKAPIDSKAANKNIGIYPSTPMRDIDMNDAETVVGWNINDMFGCFFTDPLGTSGAQNDNTDVLLQAQAFEEAHDSAEILIRVLLRTITVARASVPDRPKLHMALSTMHEALLFVRQIFRVQKKNTSRNLLKAWFRALNEISNTFGPLKQRTAALGVQIAKKFRKHGNIAKRRILRFVDIVLGDTQLLHALELGDWKQSLFRLERAIVQANITDAVTCEQLHKCVIMMYKNLAPRKKDRKSKAAAARNGQKMVNFIKIIKVIASPGRSILRLLTRDDVLAVFDRVLIRVFEKDPLCSMVINIYAWNFESMRHLRTLNNMSIAGKLWETVLDAIDEELTFATSEIPEQTKYFIEPFVKLFSLGVSQFHGIQRGSSTADWLEFLMQDEAVKIIQELDYKLIASLEALCTDIKQVVQVLPYIKTIDNDILNLMDEFNFDSFLKEITDVIGDSKKSMVYITERSAILVERFLDYLPRMSVPIEKRELQDGWVLTCRSKDGGDLRLSDLSVLRENLLLSVLGSENVFQHSTGKDDYIGTQRDKIPASVGSDLSDDEEEESILDEVRELILSAQMHGAWIAGVGGLKESYHYKGVPHPLSDFPMSDKLKTKIDLWQSSAISDFELLETAIREVSYQIQMQKEREENGIEPPLKNDKKRFNPRMDPTVLCLDIKNLTLHLKDFGFRVEKGKPLTIFDPVFEGCGSITVTNVSITLKVEIKKERAFRNGLETPRPVLQLAKFDIGLEKLKLEFTETGADWILNAVLKGFSNKITEILQENLKEQIVKQVHILLEQVNGFIDTNPDLLMNALGITMADIEESIVCV